MIIISELGDKTFLIAALMAMSHPRGVVFAAAFGALLVMSVLSAALGHAVPHLSISHIPFNISPLSPGCLSKLCVRMSYQFCSGGVLMAVPRKYTSILAAILFLVFGAKMLREGLLMSSGTDSVQDEIKEVEQELQEKDFAPVSPGAGPLSPNASKPVNAEALEAGSWRPRKKSQGITERAGGGVMNLMNLLFSPVFVQTFIMTFLGEWGDRSQIATITLAAASGTLPNSCLLFRNP